SAPTEGQTTLRSIQSQQESRNGSSSTSPSSPLVSSPPNLSPISLCCSLFNAMASATVVDHHNPDPNPNHLHLDSLPLIDLRLLSQSDLYSLSLTSSSSLSNPTRRFDDDVLIPKIDRSVFNESAGSRKQTYSRLRLAPRNSQFPIPNPKSQPTPFSHSQSRDPETRQIISLLKQLFPSSEKAENDDVLVSVPVHLAQDDSIPGPSVQNPLVGLSADVGMKRKRGRPRKDANAVMAYPMVKADVSIERHGGGDTTPGIVVQSSDGKRKRGRPRKDENRVVSVSERERKSNVKESSVTEERVKVEEAEMVMVNENGVVLDLAALGNADDSFGEALRRRTDGLETEAQLLGFLEGWREDGRVRGRRGRLCRRVSSLMRCRGSGRLCSLSREMEAIPNGQQFVSCKEVSSYLLSYFGVRNTSKPGHTDGNIPLSNELVSGDGIQQDTNITFEDESKADELATCSLMPISSVTGHEKQATFLHTENSREIQAGEIMGMPKKFDPIKTGVLQTSLKIHESVQIDREATLDAVANYDLSSDFPCAKVNKDIENCLGTYKRESISLSCEEQAMKANKSGKDLGFFEQGSAFNLTNDKLTKADEATDGGLSCGETNVFDCFPDGINDGFKASVNSVDVTKVDTDTALNGMGKERRTENIDNNQLSSTVENTKIDDADDFGNGRSISGISESHFGPEDVCTNVKKQSTSEACSLVPSILVESRRERGLCSTSSDEKTCDVGNNFYSESFRTTYEPKCDDIDISGNDDKTISFGSGHAMPDVDAMEISEHVITTGKCSNVPAQDGKSCITLSNAKNPTCSLDELCQEKSFPRNVSTPFVKQDIGSAKTGMACPSGSASSYALVNNVNNTSSSSMEELKKEEVKRSWNNAVLLAFDSSHGGPGANSVKSTGHERSSGRPSLVRSENSQTFSTGNNSSVLEDKLITGSVNGLICPNGSEQTPGFENSLNRVYSSIMWEQPNTENAESSRNNDPMTGFLNHSQPSGDVMAELMWRIDEQNVQQSGLADTSSELVQSSGCHPNFDMLSGKGADGALSVNEKFDNLSGLEGLKPGRIEKLEYNIQTAQASSHSKESKVLSYDGEMEQGFSSSAWLEKESLPSMPNIANRPETNICVWCGNEFYHESSIRAVAPNEDLLALMELFRRPRMAQPFFQFMDLFDARVAIEEEEAATVLIGAKYIDYDISLRILHCFG
ncbi:methyl-CPG-binding domain 8 protein, partial [Prunus dulcis]